jgi:microcystin-dependent protein
MWDFAWGVCIFTFLLFLLKAQIDQKKSFKLLKLRVDAIAPPTSKHELVACRRAHACFVCTDVPIGTVILWTGDMTDLKSMPVGYLPCDGNSVPPHPQFAELRALLSGGNRFGDYNSAKVPDLRGRFALCTDSTRPVAALGGQPQYQLQLKHIPPHSHDAKCSTDDKTHSHSFTSVKQPMNFVHGVEPQSWKFYVDQNAGAKQTVEDARHVHSHTIEIGETGGTRGQADPYDVMPPFIALSYLIKAWSTP